MWLLHETFWACVRDDRADPALNPTVIVRRGNEEEYSRLACVKVYMCTRAFLTHTLTHIECVHTYI